MDTKTQIQDKIVDELPNPSHGILDLTMRTGKGRIVIKLLKKEHCGKTLWVTVNEKLRDEDIPAEFTKWGANMKLLNTDIICYQSLYKQKGEYDKIILDEGQCLTEANSIGLFNGNIKYKSILLVTGTVPKHREKLEIYEKLGLKILKKITIDEGVDLGIVAPYQITTIGLELEKLNKTVKAPGFMTTEQRQYDYYTQRIEKDDLIGMVSCDFTSSVIEVCGKLYSLKEFIPKFECDRAFVILDGQNRKGYLVLKEGIINGKFLHNSIDYRIVDKDLKFYAPKHLLLQRMRFIYNLQSKTNYAIEFVKKLSGRTLVFNGSINQAERISKNTYHSKRDDLDLKKFLNKEIDILSCVNAGGTGFTYEGLDNLVIVQVNSNKRGDITQRVGRSILVQQDYTANIYILYVKNTVDEKWKNSVLESFDRNRIIE